MQAAPCHVTTIDPRGDPMLASTLGDANPKGRLKALLTVHHCVTLQYPVLECSVF
jgi:hypothetical protein